MPQLAKPHLFGAAGGEASGGADVKDAEAAELGRGKGGGQGEARYICFLIPRTRSLSAARRCNIKRCEIQVEIQVIWFLYHGIQVIWVPGPVLVPAPCQC